MLFWSVGPELRAEPCLAPASVQDLDLYTPWTQRPAAALQQDSETDVTGRVLFRFSFTFFFFFCHLCSFSPI